MKSEWFNMRMKEGEKEEWMDLAKRQDRNLSNFIRWLVSQFKKRGK